MQICHNHNRDVAGLVRTKLLKNLWSRLQPAHQNGSWCADLSDSRREQEATLADFKADVSKALSHTQVDWNAIVAVTQKPGEGAQEYGVRKFEAFQAHSRIPDADRQNPAFIQLYKDGLGPTHQASLSRSSRIGPCPLITKPRPPLQHFRHPSHSFATAADRRVTTSLTARSPSDAPETLTWEGAALASAGTTRVSTVGALCAPANWELMATHGRKNPTNPAALAQSPPPPPLPTGISSVAGSCLSSNSYSPSVRTE
ncbi:hypothetical protein chiPu_0023102 [Chiloscyllium punctatum]|uniref:Uncharacterized protein n=1 Tax=Chiloscyllium punctatum TaxID=137246 RepID=A0A401T8R5_CHIPU|nr:hypothetical protein [Chiloscyllium punctatum]